MDNIIYLLHCEMVFQGHPVFGVFNGIETEDSDLVGLAYVPDKEIDGHWLARVTDKETPRVFQSKHDIVIGITSHRERIDVKLYESARNYAQEYALSNGCEFKDETLPGQ